MMHTGFILFGRGPRAGWSEQGNEFSGFIVWCR